MSVPLCRDKVITRLKRSAAAAEQKRQQWRSAAKEFSQVLTTIPNWLASADQQLVNHLLKQLIEKIVVDPSGKVRLEFK